ncbi:MAG: two-component regulator propeller domain-containing protein [Rudaea sp.]
MGLGGILGRNLLACVACACGVLLGCAAAGAEEVPGIMNVRFRTYSTADGLSQATAMAMVQDRTGFLWIATQDGLNRFDGYGFRVYRHDRGDAWSLADSNVSALAADDDGGLWIGTQTGTLQRYDPALDRFASFTPPREAKATFSRIGALLLDARRHLWIAGVGTGVEWFDIATQSFVPVGIGTREPLRNTRAIVARGDGAILLGTSAGLWRADLDGQRMAEWKSAEQTTLDVTAIAIAADGNVWVGTAENGLYAFSANGELQAHYQRSAGTTLALPDDEVRGLNFDHAGRLWIATKNAGICRLDSARSAVSVFGYDPAQRNGIGAARQQTVFVDRDGLVWAGSWVNGVSVHDPRTEAFATIARGVGNPLTLPTQSVTSVLANADGTLWLGLPEGGGLARFDLMKGVVERQAHDPADGRSLPPGLVADMRHSRDGGLWVAAAGGGIAWQAAGSRSYVHYRHDPADPDSLANDSVLSLIEDDAGTLWAGTDGSGLDELRAGTTRFVHHVHDSARADSIGGDTVSVLLKASDGTFWVGLRGEGLDRFDPPHVRFEHFRANAEDPHSLSQNSTSTLFEDHAGGLWIGTSGGLNRLLPGSAAKPRFESFTRKDGLASEAIGSVVEDRAGKLWISTTVGISRLDPVSREISNFGVREGALAQGYFVNKHAMLADGRIVFAGLSGATLFDPAAAQSPPRPLPLITEVLLNNVPVDLRWRDPESPLERSPWTEASRVRLSHEQRNVTFAFTALGFSNPDVTKFSYRLEGHDEQWIPTGANRRYATYTDLAPGRYRFRVRARNDQSAWADADAELAVQVLPAPWLSPLAFLGYVALALFALAVSGLRWRRNWEREQASREAIRQSEERLKYALWGSGGELWDLDLRSGAILRDNRMDAIALTHEARSQTVADFRTFVYPEDLWKIDRALAMHLRGESDVFEVSFRTIDRTHREWRWMLTRGSVAERDTTGRATRLVGTTQDITVLKQSEESLRKLNEELEVRVERRTVALSNANVDLRQALEQLKLTQSQLIESEKMAALGSLVAGIAHEINTPLGVTVTAASHLEQEAMRFKRLLARQGGIDPRSVEEFEATVREIVDMILRNLRRADQLIKSFKLVAVDQSNEEERTIEIGAYLRDILTSLGPILRRTPLIKVRADCVEPVNAITYPGALYQIVSNLVVNAITHAFDAGQEGEVVLSITRDADRAVLGCRDNGLGMSEGVRAQLFEPFFTTRRGQGGSGLGMHVVYNLVTQLLRGSIRVESAPGEGAYFEIVLPLDRAVEGAPPAAPSRRA